MRLILAIALVAAGLPGPGGVRAHEVAPEASAKAAYVYNFGKFVEWPGTVQSRDSFRICVTGRGDPFLDAVLSLSGKMLQGRPISARRVDGAVATAECRILVVGVSEARNLDRILGTVEGQPVLTVSEIRGFAGGGGMIGLVLTPEDRIGFEINARAARQAGLRVSAALVELGRPVGEPGRP